MSRYRETKWIVDKLMLAGFGSGCLFFVMGTLTKIPPLSVFGFLASTGAGSFSYIVKENTTKQLLKQNEDKEKRSKDITSVDPKILLRDIFSNDFSFHIPTYQRPYTWTIEETQTLLNDLLDMMGNESDDKTQLSNYFLGNIILIQSDANKEYHVVDGQQRLTTLTILLSVLRYLTNNLDLTKYIYHTDKETETINNSPRLSLRERDNDFFEKYIQRVDGFEKIETIILEELSDSQKNIIKNAKLLSNQIKHKLPQPLQKERFTNFLLNQCSLAIISTSDFDAAYRIFSVLNDRGLDLSITDILKADLIGAISQQNLVRPQNIIDLQNKYTQKWEDIEEKLGRDKFAILFFHICMIYKKSKLKKKIIEEFRLFVLTKINNTPQFIDEVLEPFAHAFHKIENQSFRGNNCSKEVNELLKWLHRINHSEWCPPAILYLKQYGHQPEKILQFLIKLERLAIGLAIKKTHINHRIKRYSKIIQAIEENQNLSKVDSPLQLTNIEQRNIINILNGDLYQMGKKALYILLRLNTYLSDGCPDYDGYETITIEHILPQNPPSNSQWDEWFPTEEERDKYVHCLGNLVLLSRERNSSAQNYEYEVKKDKYINNPTTIFALTIQAIKEKEWTPEIIEQRQRYLLGQLQNLWKLN